MGTGHHAAVSAEVVEDSTVAVVSDGAVGAVLKRWDRRPGLQLPGSRLKPSTATGLRRLYRFEVTLLKKKGGVRDWFLVPFYNFLPLHGWVTMVIHYPA